MWTRARMVVIITCVNFWFAESVEGVHNAAVAQKCLMVFMFTMRMCHIEDDNDVLELIQEHCATHSHLFRESIHNRMNSSCFAWHCVTATNTQTQWGLCMASNVVGLRGN